jgi:REP element-mobilizing transposase RayT
MPQSLDNVLVHLVYSTKNRTARLTPAIREELFPCLVGVLRNHGCRPLQVGGVEDHAHLLFALTRTKSIAQIVEEAKTGSSKWVKTKGVPSFAWQVGYGVFSVSPEDANHAITYVRDQESHHKKVSFMDEFRTLMREAGIEMDERFVWD